MASPNSEDNPLSRSFDGSSTIPIRPVFANDSSDLIEQTFELEAFAAAVRALEQAKETTAGRCMHLIASPIGGLLDVVKACNIKACNMNTRAIIWSICVVSALIVLDGKLDKALILLPQLVVSTHSKYHGYYVTEKLRSDLLTLASLLENMSRSIKHILTQAQSSSGTSRVNIMRAVQSAVQEFAVVNLLCIEDVVAFWSSWESENDGASNQHLLDHRNEVETEIELGKIAYKCYDNNGTIDKLNEAIGHYNKALTLCDLEHHHLRFKTLISIGFALLCRFQVLSQEIDSQNAVSHLHDALQLCPQEEPFRHVLLKTLADESSARYDKFGRIADLNQVIKYHRMALELRPHGHPDRPTSLISLANALRYRFNRLGQIADLEEAIGTLSSALELHPHGHLNRWASLNSLANALRTRFDKLGQIVDLEQAISYHCSALELCSPGHLGRSNTLNDLGIALGIRFEQSGQMADLEQAISYHRGALELHPSGHPNRPVSLSNLASALWICFQQTGRMADLEQAISYHRGALEAYAPGHPGRYVAISGLAIGLNTRFSRLGQMEDLDQAIGYHRGALNLCPRGHTFHSTSLNNLATALRTRFDRSGQITDLEQAISYHRDAVDLQPPGHPNRSTSLSNLAIALWTRFEKTSQMTDLEQSINYHRCTLDLRPPGHPNRSTSLDSLAIALRTRFEQLGQSVDLEQAITYHRDALNLYPPGNLNRSASLSSLASALRTRFEQTGQNADLEQAIKYRRDDLELYPPGHPDRSTSLNNLGTTLVTSFNHSGQIAELEQALDLHNSALELQIPGHPGRCNSLNSLANALWIRYEQIGQIADLERAVIKYRDALEICPLGDPSRSKVLNNLGNTLRVCFQQSGQMIDLEQSIRYHHKAVELQLPGHHERPTSLNNLASSLRLRFDRTGQVSELEQAIVCYRSALEMCPHGHPRRPVFLVNYASTIHALFLQSGQMVDLEQAICYNREAIELLPSGHPFRSGFLNNLANVLVSGFAQTSRMEELEQAISYHRDALELRSPGHRERFRSLINLATALRIRFERSNQIENLEDAIGLLQSGAREVTDTPKSRYVCASQLILLLEKQNHPSLLDAYKLALEILQLVLAVYPNIKLRRESLNTESWSLSLAMSAAAYAVEQGQPEQAVEILEQGRSLLWSGIRGYRESVAAVGQIDAALADRFRVISKQLEALATSAEWELNKSISEGFNESVAVSEARWTQQRRLLSERDEVVQQIRQLAGFDHFLRAVPFSELQQAAAEGPIVIVNVAQRRSDAIILHQRDKPIVLPLCVEKQSREGAYSVISSLSELLFQERGKLGFSKTLNDDILNPLAKLLVTPVLKELERLGVTQQSRIWWCPTSALCALPIHAAGELPNKYISSYTPTLSALIGARKVDNVEPFATRNESASNPSLLTVIYPGHPPQTEGAFDDRLLTVSTERNVIEKAAKDSKARSVVRTDPTRQAVLDKLPDHSWVHFACHGRLNIVEPFKSHFELEGEPLTLSDLVQARLPNADFAFLAACDSATSGGISKAPDESLHLAAAVQFCGVRSVVGTLWPMADEDGPRVAQVFYRYMFKENDPRKSAEALHKVVTALRRKAGPWKNAADAGELLQRWANYIHIGA